VDALLGGSESNTNKHTNYFRVPLLIDIFNDKFTSTNGLF